MSHQFEIAEEPGRHVAVTRFTATAAEIGQRMGPAFGAVYASLERHGLHAEGPAVAYYVMGADAFDVRAGFVVAEPVEPDGEVEPFRLPARRYVATTYVGPYEQLPTVYAALEAWAREEGHSLDQEGMWEEYLTGPEVAADQQVTRICWPLAD